MSKRPPPPVKPKPKNLAKPALPTKPTGIDNLLSQPISMSEYPESEEDELSEPESKEVSPIPVTPARKQGLTDNLHEEPADTIGSPFKQGVTSRISSFPPPPKRNVGIDSTYSPLRKVSDTIDTEPDFAEGMRSPLKVNIQTNNPINKPSLDKKYTPPPPPKRNMQSKNNSNTKDDDEHSLHESAPPLPARRETSNRRVDIVDAPPPALPRRRETPNKHVSPPLFPDSDVDHEYSDEQEDERSVHVRRVAPTKSSKHHSHSTSRTASYGYDSDDRDENRSDLASSSSQLFNQAKTFSKESFTLAREKSAPYLSKVKGTIKSKLNKESSPKYNISDDEDENIYRSQRRSARGPSPPVRKSSNNGNYRNEDASSDDDDSETGISQSHVEDISFDEDRPALPARRVAVPLPGLTDDALKPPYKVKSQVPTKIKPAPPPKKSTLKPPPPLSARSSSPSNSISSATSSNMSAVPPPPPSRARPAAPPPRSANTWKEPQLDLQLPTLWFIKDGSLPSDLQNLNYQCSHGFVGPKEFKVYAFRLNDLSTLRLKLVWKSGSPELYTEEVSFIPPPTATKKLLTEGHEKYGEHVANWCEVKEGTTVGNGECWTLAHDALEKACGKYAFVSSGLNHGALLATYTPTGVTTPNVTDDLRRGDILQFTSCVFEYPNRTLTFGAPDHTAIVLDVKPSEDTSKDPHYKWVEIIHQNIGGVKKVRVGEIDLAKLKSGEIKAFRPVDSTWVTPLADVVI
ncbi:hypothetical protein CANINC_005004 [Pichia inconspicua]|uniref:BBC1/AIM3 cysteine proteinase-fold domain-containing protein n=1 Tax=Pichia inconspicua TaxID=52247 RepID=A0A4T0WW28_9ASCO|nr:hypothetical protein CANINC_005004 [[Candida] inconspicua]